LATNTQEKSNSGEANNSSASQEICILKARNFTTVLTKAHDFLSHRNPVHIRREEMNKLGGEQQRKQER